MSSEAEIRINQLYADAMQKSFMQVRYGMKSCRQSTDVDLTYDLKKLLEFTEQKIICVDTVSACCSLAKITEKINTL